MKTIEERAEEWDDKPGEWTKGCLIAMMTELAADLNAEHERSETELTATRARLTELEGIAERLYRQIGSKENDDTVPAMLAYEAYKEGKK